MTLTRLSLLFRPTMSPRSEATLFGFSSLFWRECLSFALTVAQRLAPRRFGPSVRLASSASDRNRFVLLINVTVVILRLRFCQSGQAAGAAHCAGGVPDARCGVSSFCDNDLARSGEKLGWAKRLTDSGRLTGIGLHFDRIGAMIPEEIEVHRDRMWRRDPEKPGEGVFTAGRVFAAGGGFGGVFTHSGG